MDVEALQCFGRCSCSPFIAALLGVLVSADTLVSSLYGDEIALPALPTALVARSSEAHEAAFKAWFSGSHASHSRSPSRDLDVILALGCHLAA